MFLSRNKKNNVYLCKPQFYYMKVGFKGVNIRKVCFRDDRIFPYNIYGYERVSSLGSQGNLVFIGASTSVGEITVREQNNYADW